MPEFVFSRKRDGSFQLESCESPDANLVIPSEHEGRPVTSIAENAFSWCYQIRLFPSAKAPFHGVNRWKT